MFDRTKKLIGEDNFFKIQKSIVVVIGLGGVGGYAVESLVRSGVENIIIVDYDTVDVSNLNRQIVATQNNIGLFKVDAMEQRILEINPDCNVVKLCLELNSSNILELFEYSFDYLIDACDTILVKEELIRICLEKEIVFISSMGTGNKIDPSKLEIADISKTSYDPIARRIRKYLKENNICGKVPVVYSKEQGGKFMGSIPSMTFVPAVSGLMCSNYIIRKIIEADE